jgi:hypothetical protein
MAEKTYFIDDMSIDEDRIKRNVQLANYIATKCESLGLESSAVSAISYNFSDLYYIFEGYVKLIEHLLNLNLSDLEMLGDILVKIQVSCIEHAVWHIKDVSKDLNVLVAYYCGSANSDIDGEDVEITLLKVKSSEIKRNLRLADDITNKIKSTGIKRAGSTLGKHMAAISMALEHYSGYVDQFLDIDNTDLLEIGYCLFKIRASLEYIHYHIMKVKGTLERVINHCYPDDDEADSEEASTRE